MNLEPAFRSFGFACESADALDVEFGSDYIQPIGSATIWLYIDRGRDGLTPLM